jgi:hypothetical protein
VTLENCWVVSLWDGLAEGEKKNFEFKFGSKLLVTYFRCDGSDRKRIRIWKMGIPPVLIHDRICKFRNLRLVKVDERFIVLRSIKTFYFISTETFEEIQTLRHDYNWDYNRGLLFQLYGDTGNEKIIHILDVASGTFFSDVCLPFRNETRQSVRLMYHWASSNSKFIVPSKSFGFQNRFEDSL